jgi:hypothetical protein
MPVPDSTELTEFYRGIEMRAHGTPALEAAKRERDRYWSTRLLEAAGPKERAEILREEHALRAMKRSERHIISKNGNNSARIRPMVARGGAQARR